MHEDCAGTPLDDVVSTLMLNMFYGGRLKSMPPKLLSDAKEHIVIRPLVYLREKDLARWCRIKGYDVIPKLCGADDVCRREMKEIIQGWIERRRDEWRTFSAV